MKLVLCILLIGIPLAAEDTGKTPAKRDERKPTQKVETPFGPTTRSATNERPAPRTLAQDPQVKVEESGETITFRRQTPFGEQVWRRQRSELSEAEKELLAARSRTPEQRGASTLQPAAAKKAENPNAR